MPSTNQAGSSRERERSDDPLVDEAYRWLDREIIAVEDPGGCRSREKVVKSIIEGIDTLARARAWRAAEKDLERGEGENPREGILQAIEDRVSFLESNGDRSERCQGREEERNLGDVEVEYPDRPDIDGDDDRGGYTPERTFGSLEERYPHMFEDDTDQTDQSSTDEAASRGEAT